MAERPIINRKISQYNFTQYTGRAVSGIVMHYVGAVSTAKNNADYFSTGNRNASAHFFVDRSEIWQSVEIENAAWHCGGGPDSQGSGGSSWGDRLGNYNTIGIEMCCEHIDGVVCVPWETVERAATLVQWLLSEYDIDPAAVCRHFDITGKNCPAWVEIDGHAAKGTNHDNWFRVWTALVGGAQEEPEGHSRLTVDGYWGEDTTRALQRHFGLEETGIVEGQYSLFEAENHGLTTGWEWQDDLGDGSEVIKAIQRELKVEGDGIASPLTFAALQIHYGLKPDGEIWMNSPTVRAMQEALNEGRF